MNTKISTTLEDVLKSGHKLTPMMQQYSSIKKELGDTICLFRMGDFYEVFFEDAQTASRVLNIALTHRGKIGDLPVPMAGIPHHAASNYIDKLSHAGLKAAIVEQIEDPKEAKGIVKRAVTQIVTPGMPYDLEKTAQEQTYYIATSYKKNEQYYLVLLDYTTGEFRGLVLDNEEDFFDKVALYRPKEFLTFLGQWDSNTNFENRLNESDCVVTHLSEEYFQTKLNEELITKLIPNYNRDNIIKKNIDVLNCIPSLSFYLVSSQLLDAFIHVKPFHLEGTKNILKVSNSTLTGLEILPRGGSRKSDSLLGFMDETRSASGKRLMRNLFLHPLADSEAIKSRQKLIAELVEKDDTLDEIRELLKPLRDLERIQTKIATKRANAQDLFALCESIKTYSELISNKTFKINKHKTFPILSKTEFEQVQELSDIILKRLNPEMGASLEKGNLILKGNSRKRDRLANLAQNAQKSLEELEEKYRKKSGIPKLRIKFNNVAGFFIEVSKLHSNKVPKSFERKQTLVNSERYSTKELKEFEKEVLSAKDKLQALERELFQELINLAIQHKKPIHKLSDVLSLLDVFQSFAYIASTNEWTCPQIIDDKRIFKVEKAYHPLIKASIKDSFVSHSLELDEERGFILITGPNMAGKTTVMREMAIIQYLTQLGCFVPAQKASISLCDFIFSRLGAHDDITKGQSTFMVEMSETAEILRHATKRSFIVLDEVGRGTSTYDGLSIAWALVEYLNENIKAFTLFSTHYHELIELADELVFSRNMTVETINRNGDVRFLYNLIEGAASQSFGIHVAKMAGLPQNILLRSQQVLEDLEKNNHQVQSEAGTYPAQLSLFEETISEKNYPLLDEIKTLELNDMTPRSALQKLYDIKDQLTLQ